MPVLAQLRTVNGRDVVVSESTADKLQLSTKGSSLSPIEVECISHGPVNLLECDGGLKVVSSCSDAVQIMDVQLNSVGDITGVALNSQCPQITDNSGSGVNPSNLSSACVSSSVIIGADAPSDPYSYQNVLFQAQSNACQQQGNAGICNAPMPSHCEPHTSIVSDDMVAVANFVSGLNGHNAQYSVPTNNCSQLKPQSIGACPDLFTSVSLPNSETGVLSSANGVLSYQTSSGANITLAVTMPSGAGKMAMRSTASGFEAIIVGSGSATYFTCNNDGGNLEQFSSTSFDGDIDAAFAGGVPWSEMCNYFNNSCPITNTITDAAVTTAKSTTIASTANSSTNPSTTTDTTASAKIPTTTKDYATTKMDTTTHDSSDAIKTTATAKIPTTTKDYAATKMDTTTHDSSDAVKTTATNSAKSTTAAESVAVSTAQTSGAPIRTSSANRPNSSSLTSVSANTTTSFTTTIATGSSGALTLALSISFPLALLFVSALFLGFFCHYKYRKRRKVHAIPDPEHITNEETIDDQPLSARSATYVAALSNEQAVTSNSRKGKPLGATNKPEAINAACCIEMTDEVENVIFDRHPQSKSDAHQSNDMTSQQSATSSIFMVGGVESNELSRQGLGKFQEEQDCACAVEKNAAKRNESREKAQRRKKRNRGKNIQKSAEGAAKKSIEKTWGEGEETEDKIFEQSCIVHDGRTRYSYGGVQTGLANGLSGACHFLEDSEVSEAVNQRFGDRFCNKSDSDTEDVLFERVAKGCGKGCGKGSQNKSRQQFEEGKDDELFSDTEESAAEGCAYAINSKADCSSNYMTSHRTKNYTSKNLNNLNAENTGPSTDIACESNITQVHPGSSASVCI